MPTILDQALEELRQLPAASQEAIARDLLELIRSERKWDELFADPRSETILKRLAAEADQEALRGEDFAFDPATRPVAKVDGVWL
jgi:hypothetical protein